MDILILGPMGTEPSSGQSSNTCIIRDAIQDLLKEAGLASLHDVMAPEDLRDRQIPSAVLAALDTAELVVVDLSGNSPNVFYELALADALGVPAILLTDMSTQLPFYLKHSRVHLLPIISIDSVKATLRTYLLPDEKAVGPDLVSSPVCMFYDAPIVDISAATGLAVGYSENFLLEVLNEEGAFAKSFPRPKGVLTIIPRTTGEMTKDLETIVSTLAQLGAPDLRTESIPRPPPKRPFSARFSGRMIVDLATPVYSLEKSPRMERLEKLRGDEQWVDRQRTQMRTTLCHAFERSLDRQLRGAKNRADMRLFWRCPLDRLAEDLKRPPVSTWWIP